MQRVLLKCVYTSLDYAQTGLIAAVFFFKVCFTFICSPCFESMKCTIFVLLNNSILSSRQMMEWWYQSAEERMSAPTVYPPPPPPPPPKVIYSLCFPYTEIKISKLLIILIGGGSDATIRRNLSSLLIYYTNLSC